MRSRRIVVGLLFLVSISIGLGWLGYKSFYRVPFPALVLVASGPAGAEVWRDGKLIGLTPIAEELYDRKEVTYTLRAKGFEDVHLWGALHSNRILTFHPVLQRKRPVTADGE